MRLVIAALAFSCFVFSSCSPPKPQQTMYQKEHRYNQDININVAALIKEQNDTPVKPTPNCSGFLVDKTSGIFGSAKHCIGATGRWKIFYGGKVYDGFVLSTPAVSDLVLIKVHGQLDGLSNAPNPYPIASTVRVGDKVFVRGIHPHPPERQEGRQIIPIWKDYYGIYWAKAKLVFDNLEAEIVNVNNPQRGNELGLGGTVSGELSSIYYKMKTAEDHKMPFSGLSGGPVVNEREELVGVLSWQRVRPEEEEFRFETEEFVIEGSIIKPIYREVNAVPAKELEELRRHR